MLAGIQTNNIVIIEGHLGKDCQSFKLTNNDDGVNFSVAINNGRDKEGNEVSPTFVNCTKFKAMPFELSNLKKGQLVKVIGRLDADKYEKNGVTVNTLRVIASDITFYNIKELNAKEKEQKQSSEPASTPAPSTSEYLTPADSENPWA